MIVGEREGMAVGKAPLICRCGQMSALGFTHHRWQEEDRVSQSWHKRRLRVEPVLLEATASPRERGLAAMCTDSARNDPARNDRQPLVVLLSVPSGREPGRRVKHVQVLRPSTSQRFNRPSPVARAGSGRARTEREDMGRERY